MRAKLDTHQADALKVSLYIARTTKTVSLRHIERGYSVSRTTAIRYYDPEYRSLRSASHFKKQIRDKTSTRCEDCGIIIQRDTLCTRCSDRRAGYDTELCPEAVVAFVDFLWPTQADQL